MGLFNFSKRIPTVPIQDMIWMSKSAKLNGCKNLVASFPDALVVAWFSDTVDDFARFLNEQNNLGVEIHQARSILSVQAANKMLILLEHYPMRSKEIEFIASMNPQKVFVLSSLDEPLFEQFGSDRIIQLMQSLGMKDDEMIQHPMISKAIENAQEKLEKKVTFENSASSAKDWFDRNYVS